MARKKKFTGERYLAMSEAEREELHKEICRGYTESCFETALRTGAVDPKGKTEAELHLELLQYTLDHLDQMKEAGDIAWIIDHTRELLGEARRYRRRKEDAFALLFYATWSEHWLNSLVHTACQKKDLSQETAEQILRDCPFRAKTTWVIELLELPPIPNQALAALSELQNLRNGFVHYKFRAHGEEGMKQEEQQIRAALSRAEEMVRALTQYENKHIFKQGRGKAQRLARTVGKRKGKNASAPRQTQEVLT